MISRIGKRGFTLIEVLVSVAVLSVGILFIFRSFFTCLDAFDRYVAYYNILPWMNEKLWQAEDEAIRTGMSTSNNQGEFIYEGKIFSFSLSSRLVDEKEKLCRLDLSVTWQQARKPIVLERYAYTMLE